ncbi:hypothetical protein ACWDOG_31005, partial [Streptomyces fungicidicus]
MTTAPDTEPGTRQHVHAASGNRLGVAHPRQEGPADLRLVPPALAAWATAAVTLHAPPGRVAGVVIAALLAAGALLAARGRPARRAGATAHAGA